MASEGEPHGQAVERIAFISGYHLISAWRVRASPHNQVVERIAFISGYHLTSVWCLRASPMAKLSSVLRLYLVTISFLYGV